MKKTSFLNIFAGLITFLLSFKPAFCQDAEGLIGKMTHAMGGMQAWNQLPVIQWTFDARQTFYWDKKKDSIIMDRPSKQLLVKMHLITKQGNAWQNGEQVLAKDLDDCLKLTYLLWVNDSYWLAMPFKLKDPGVNLTYDGLDQGIKAHKIEINFNSGVGLTPRNKYIIWINKESFLIEKWAFYMDRDDTKPTIITKWGNYQEFEGVLLSLDREYYQITDVGVLDQLPRIDTFFNR